MICNICGKEMKLVPEGVSKKTGKTYKAFYSCWTCKKTAPADNQTSTAKPFIPVERKSLKDEPEYKELIKELNDLKWAVHALVATLIIGTDKEQAYELHKIPLIEKSKSVEEEINPDDLPF